MVECTGFENRQVCKKASGVQISPSPPIFVSYSTRVIIILLLAIIIDNIEYMQDLIKTLDLYLGKKAPQIPKGGKEWIVKYAPYITIIGLIFMASAILNSMKIYSLARTFFPVYGYGISSSTIISIIYMVLSALALPGLFKRNANGWNFSMYAIVVGSLSSFDPFSILISLLLGLYVLFQIKPYYFGGAVISEVDTQPSTPTEEKPTETVAPVSENQEPKQ